MSWLTRSQKNALAGTAASKKRMRESVGQKNVSRPWLASANGIASNLARTTVPPQLTDATRRAKWGLPPPDRPHVLGPYIVELNVEHIGGLSEAEKSFLELYNNVIRNNVAGDRATGVRRKPLKLDKSYFRCDLSDNEWSELIAEDEKKVGKQRAVYRLWPDFELQAHTDHSVATIKADAAMRSFNATGDGIVWAVIDSGIDGIHPHFGQRTTQAELDAHILHAQEVVGLHRCFAEIDRVGKGELVLLPDPDDGVERTAAEREALLNEHRTWATTDDFGHGTHVAGIISGRAPSNAPIVVCERRFDVDKDGNKVNQSYAPRHLPERPSDPLGIALHGVAPLTKIVSLRVLDKNGKGRASQIIKALEYVRERLNDNPKLMRVHGVNLSVGYEFDAEMFACGQSPLCNAVNRLVQEGVVVVAAAGNTGFGTVAASVGTSQVGLSNTINDPGNAADAITVGATHRDSPHTYGVSYFSSKGPTADGRLKPDLVAPGERITSCATGTKLRKALACLPAPPAPAADSPGATTRNTTATNTAGIDGAGADRTGANSTGETTAVTTNPAYYVDDSGTSMAAPHVSGAVAAFLSIRREFIGKPYEVKRIFLDSATSLGREQYFEGHGMVDLMRAIQLV